MRLIDADKLIELCNIMADICDGIGAIWEQFRIAVEWSPIVDAEPVVRCKDCGWSYTDETKLICVYRGFFVNDMFYCADGKRREDETN